jgi:putative ABC transport system permease protein
MIKSIFKIMWKRKKNSKLIIAEMLISFLLLFGLSVTLLKIAGNYLEPLGFDFENIWALNVDYNTNLQSGEDTSKRLELFNLLIKEIKASPNVVNLTICSQNIPYGMSVIGSSIQYKNKTCNNPNKIDADIAFAEVMNLKMEEGRWYNYNDAGQKEIPIVINSTLKDILFENEPAINKVVHSGKYKVVGIVKNYKIKGEFAENSPTFFTMLNPEGYYRQVLIKSKPEPGASFEAELLGRISEMSQDWTITIRKLSDYRKDRFKLTWTPILIVSAISGFLIINILLGLLGLLWYNVNHRKSEIGLRKSVGAPAKKIIQQFTWEMLVMATLGIIPGLLIAIQFPILKAFDVETKIYVMAMLLATLLIYLLVTLCALLPSSQAAKILPAEALHEE